MLRNDIQKITGLTRKALEYYEGKGFIHPRRLENGYREYSEKDVEILNQIALFKKLGLTITEIKDCLKTDGATPSSILRRKEQELESDEKRKVVFDLYIKGADTDKRQSEEWLARFLQLYFSLYRCIMCPQVKKIVE